MTAKATVTLRLDRGKAPKTVAADPVPRIARLLAFAHMLDAEIRAGVYNDLADAAKKLGLTRARVTQIANLTLLAPAIQEEIAATPPTVGRHRITERALRTMLAKSAWARQTRS